MVAANEVQLGEHLARELNGEVQDVRQEVSIMYRDIVQTSVNPTGSPAAIVLRYDV